MFAGPSITNNQHSNLFSPQRLLVEVDNLRKNKFLKAVVFAIAGIPFNAISIHAQVPAAPLTLRRTILLSEVTGKFDHFAIDEEGDRLFAAAEGSHAVEIIDLATGKIAQTLSGLGKPHGLAWVAASGSLYVTDGALAELRVYKGKASRPCRNDQTFRRRGRRRL